jgi:ketosteroid isomerase-like protein
MLKARIPERHGSGRGIDRPPKEPTMSAFKSDFLRTLSERGFIHQISDETGLDDLLAKETVTAYIGFDPPAWWAIPRSRTRRAS